MPDSALPPGTTLAARCTACGTVFRVVPDQLRVSDGWVRCGRCAQVFNAAKTLVDPETGAPRQLDQGLARRPLPGAGGNEPTPSPPPSPSPSPTPDWASAPAPDWEPPPSSSSAPILQREPQPASLPPSAAFTPLAGEAVATPVTPLDPPLDRPLDPPLALPESPSNQTETASTLAEVPQPQPQPSLAADSPSLPAVVPAGAPPAGNSAAPLPSFLRRADRAARWRQPRVRAALGIGSLLAALLLVGQAAHAWRDQAAARFPGLRPLLVAGCQALGCQVGPARAIESLTVESSALLRIEQSRLYQLTVSLRNRSTLDLAMPALELSLTDAQGRVLSRRVLRAAELGASQPTLGGGRDLALQATLQTAPQSTAAGDAAVVVGYTIELFYP